MFFVDDLFRTEEDILIKTQAYIDNLGEATTVDAKLYIELFIHFKRFVKQTKRTMRIADRMTSELNCAKHELSDKANIDELTQIYNRRYMVTALEHCYDVCIKSSQYLSVIMLDIDYFKNYNDSLGHQMGDICLKQVAKVLTDVIHRHNDIVARYGGEEFIIILPNTEEGGAVAVADKIVESIYAQNIPHPKSLIADRVTVSLGVTSCIPSANIKADDLIKAADNALYEAKGKGRNRFIYRDAKEK